MRSDTEARLARVGAVFIGLPLAVTIATWFQASDDELRLDTLDLLYAVPAALLGGGLFGFMLGFPVGLTLGWALEKTWGGDADFAESGGTVVGVGAAIGCALGGLSVVLLALAGS